MMRVPVGALTEAACSLCSLSSALAPPPSASRRRWRVARSERCGGSLPGYLLRALVGWDVRGEVSLYPARRVLRDPPPSAPFSGLLPLRACISLLSVCPSLFLFCARHAPAKMLRNAEISKNLKGTPLFVQSQNLSGAPLRANRCREMPRGRRVF